MKLCATLMMLAGGATLARAAETMPPVAEVVAHARAVMDKKAPQVVCKVVVDTQLLDKTGKPEHDEHREGKATLRGDDQDIESTKVVRDGRVMTADELADERAKVQKDKQQNAKKKKKGGDDDFDLSPLAAKNASHESFELVGKELLWGRPAYVLKVHANTKSPQQANGTLWIDAERFVELKGELIPSEMPPHADWIKVQEQYVPGPNDVAVPSYLHIEGAGHMLFMRKQFRTTLRWSECR
jgi:hypothetical protein